MSDMEQEQVNPDILALLQNAGIDLDTAKAELRKASKAATDEKAAMFAERKESNREAVIDLACEVRQTLEERCADLLPGTVLTFTVRRKDDRVIATANDCHASKVIESIHVDPKGEPCFGAEGAAQAKNVRARKKSA